MGNTNVILETEIYPRLSHEIVFSDLNPKERGSYYVMDCPFCGHKGEFYGYKGKPFGVCNRKNNCGKTLTWWNHIQQKYNLTQQETLLKLAEMAHVELDVQKKKLDPKKKAEEDMYSTFWEIIREEFKTWKEGKNYLIRKRQFPEESLKTLEFGYFPKDAVLRALKAKGFNENQIKESAIGTSGFGTLYKLILPWRDEFGKIRGFVGRCIGDPLGNEPKYRYSRGLDMSVPFNIHNSKIGNDVLIVEGTLDALHLMAEGFRNVVALGRDNLTSTQADNLIRLKKTDFFLALDTDEAGRRGTVKTIELLVSRDGINTYVVNYQPPSGAKDPDECLRTPENTNRFRNALEDSQKGVCWLAGWILSNYKTDLDTGREEAISRTVQVLEKIWDPVARKDFKASMAKALKTPQEELERKAKALRDQKIKDFYQKRMRDSILDCYNMLKAYDLRGIEKYLGQEIGHIKEEGKKRMDGAREYLSFLKEGYSLLKSSKPNTFRIMIEKKIKEMQKED